MRTLLSLFFFNSLMIFNLKHKNTVCEHSLNNSSDVNLTYTETWNKLN